MGFTTTFRDQRESKSVILDIRDNGILVKTAFGDSREIALARAIGELEEQVERGKKAAETVRFLKTVDPNSDK